MQHFILEEQLEVICVEGGREYEDIVELENSFGSCISIKHRGLVTEVIKGPETGVKINGSIWWVAKI